jgi:hypothetical protein
MFFPLACRWPAINPGVTQTILVGSPHAGVRLNPTTYPTASRDCTWTRAFGTQAHVKSSSWVDPFATDPPL